MKTLGLLLALAISAASPSLAQTIRVQSGDHAGFTRLVLSIGADRDWELEQQSAQQWVLSISPAIDGFDISRAFDLIPRTRLAGLEGTDTLSLNLACLCDLTSFRHNNQYLVIDIADGDPDALEVTEDVAPTPAEDARAAAVSALPNLTSVLLAPTSLPQVSPLIPAIAPNEDVPIPELVEDAPNPRLAEAAEIMAEQLARAAASGLLDAALEEFPSIDELVEASPPAPIETDDLPSPPPPPPPIEEAPFPEGPLPIRTETGLDPRLEVDLSDTDPQEENACSGMPLNARDWSDSDHIEVGLGALRLELFDERDALVDDAAIRLARHYLAYGFGAEATYWLTQVTAPSEDLLHIATLVDGGESAPFPIVDTPEDCSDGELLWRYLAGSVTADLTQDDTATLQRAYSDLPRGLRDHMGPRLARLLSADGHHSTARNIRDTLHRGGRMDEVALRILDLDLRIAPNATLEQTRDILTEALRDDGGDPVTIMTQSLAFDRTNGQRADPSRLVAADGLMRETGQGPETDDLWREVLLGHAGLGQIEEALNRLGDPVRSAEARAAALTDLIADRVAVNDTAALVILAYTYGRNWRPEGSEAGRIQVRAIAALRDEGLFEAAQILRDVRRPLILPSPPPADVPDADASIDAWAQADWTLLAETSSGTHADIATRMARLEGDISAPPPATGAPDLNALFDRVTDSRTLRQEISDLLNRPTPP